MSPSRSARRTTVLAAVIAVLLTTACAGRSATVTSTADGDVGSPSGRWSGQLLPRGQPPLGGNVVIAPSSNEHEMVVILSVSGAPSLTQALAWRLYQGTCGSSGVVVGTAGEYPPVVMRTDGSGESTATLEEDVPTRGVYSVRVFANTSPGAPLVACGDVTRSRG